MIWDLDKRICLLSLIACLGMPNPLAVCGVIALIVVCRSDVTPTKGIFVTSPC